MRKINTLEDLKAEKKRLQSHRLFLEVELKKDMAELKSSLAPLGLVAGGAKKMLSSSESGIVGSTIGHAANFLTKNVLLRNSGFVTRLLVPFIVKNLASNLADDHKSQIADWVGNLISKFSGRKSAKESLAS